MNDVTEKNTAIEKALDILGLFALNNAELGTAEIGRMLGYHKATASRTLLLLKKHDFLEQDEKTKKFKLGSAIVNLGLAVNGSLKNDFVQIAKPFLENLRDTLQETVTLEVLSGRNTVMAHVAEGPRRIRLGADVGTLMNTIISAGAKAILAFASPEDQDRFLDAELVSLTSKSITDRRLIYKQLEKIKKTRIAFDIGEHNPDLNAIGSPILNMEGTPVAAVAVVGLANRIGNNPDSKAAREVKKTAQKISKKLYYSNRVPDSLLSWLGSIKVEE